MTFVLEDGKVQHLVGSTGKWYFSVPLTDELEQYVRALGLTEDLLLGRVPGDAARELDQKLPGETR